MATITTSTYLDSAARSAGEAMAIGNGAVFTVRTDTRIHSNAPASFTGSLGSPTFTDIGGEFFVDASAVRWLAYSGGTGNSPAIGTTISQGGVSGYFLGAWASQVSAPTASGAALPASGFLKFREVTGGAFAAGALTGIAATASGADVTGWIECAWDAAVNFVVPRVGKFKSRGGFFEIGTTNGAVGQTIGIPTSSSSQANNFCPGAWVEKYPGSGAALGEVDGYEFWEGLSSAANMWRRESLGFAEGFTDSRGKFVKAFAGGLIQFGETATLAATYASLAAQAGTYAGIALTCTYVLDANVVTVNTAAVAHLLEDGQQIYLDFTSGAATDGTYTVTVLDAYNFTVPLVAANTSGNATGRPGVTITFTAHALNQGEQVYCDFTSGTGVDGTYTVYAVTGANTYLVAYPHAAALTGGNVSCLHTLVITYTAHGHAIGNDVYCDFTSGTGVDGRYVMKAVAANTININMAHSAAIATSNVTLRWTIGHVPASGCKVKISNILWAECATASRQTNSVPNATIASRPEFTTTNAGAIDLESIYTLSGRSIFAQPYSVRLYNCAFSESLDISECASALDINNIGVGQYSAQDARALLLTSNFAGGTLKNIWAQRSTLGTTDHSSEFLYCRGQTIENLNTGIVGYVRSTGVACNIGGSQNLTFNGLRVFNGNVPISTSVGIEINNLDYNDRYIGKTSPTTAYYAVTVAAGCDKITLNGLTTGMGNTIDDCHPYAGVLNSAGATNIKARNIGTAASYLKTGVWAPNYAAMGVGFVSGGNNATVKLQKWMLGRLRTYLLTTINSDKNMLVEQVVSSYPWLHSAKAARTEAVAWLNADVKGLTSGILITASQASVYGTHWLNIFQGKKFGGLTLVMNEPTAETAAYFSNPAGVVKFNSAGGVEMRAIGAEGICEMPYFAYGHTAFVNTVPVMTGGGAIGNFTLTYQIDTGSGWNGTWKSLTGANLSAESISAGFKLKIKIVTSTTNTAAITMLRVQTNTTKAAQDAINYPLDTVNTSLQSNTSLVGAEIRIYDMDNSPAGSLGTEITGVESNPTSGFSFSTTGNNTVWIQIIHSGYNEFGYQYTTGTSDTSLPVTLVADTNT